ncbi:MAG: hypothetical protein KKE23_03715 [Nanoarchaeota archaeon]|nr:hypothetical protein [Nanoarchaeota archaeon]
MALNKKELCTILGNALKNDKSFERALMIVGANSFNGNIWIIGGFVYQTLANQIYGTDHILKDYDFIVQNPMARVAGPPGWTVQRGTQNYPKLIQSSGEMIIDFIPLNEIYSIKKRNLKPTIQNFLSGTPLDIQSIAYEVNNKTLEGDLGIQSLENKIVRINNFQMAAEYINMKNGGMNKYLSNIATNLDFKAELV